MTESQAEETDEPIRLQDEQRDIRDAFFNHKSGLFTLPCVPGAGKSTVAFRLAPEDILRHYVDGDTTPEQHIAIISFNRDEAADILPTVCEQFRTIVEHDLCPVASEVSEEEVEYLIQRLQQAPFIGTIDSLLRGVLKEFVHDIGFDEMPSVGNEALLRRVHADCYDQLKNEPEHRERLEALAEAYPDGEHDSSPAEMLEKALTYCRDLQFSTDEFKRKLERTQAAVYADGEPDGFADIVTAVERAVDDSSIGNDAMEQVEESERDVLVSADKALYEAWEARIDDFCDVLAAYREVYRETTREYGVLSHTDTAYLVAEYFDGSLAELGDETDETCRRRVQQRYHSRLRTLVIDEAQDVSKIQHAALSHLVHPDMRVFACGDTLQSIYTWRHADPTLFQSAAKTGTYLGIDWDTHVTETATTTYRCEPDIVAAVNEISEPMFADPARGNLGALDTKYSRLEAARDQSEDTSVHITSFRSNQRPGTESWARPEDGNGEADMLATHLSKGLADGTFTDTDGEPFSITVLFRRETRMSDYEAAFEDAGLRVKNASDNLFDSPAIETLFAVCDWLVAPESPDRIQRLIVESDLNLTTLHDEFDEQGWNIDAILETDEPSESQRQTLTGLKQLRNRRDTFEMLSASMYLEEIVERLSFRADPNELLPATEPQQRTANLDALIDLVAEWESDEQYSPKELTELVSPFREDTDRGPSQPSTSTADHDVAFQTVHRVKGDEDDVVVVADPGFNASWVGPHTTRLVTRGPVAGLAPPTDVEVPAEVDIPPLENSLYNPDAEFARDIGLRWATVQWRDNVNGTADSEAFVGFERLQQVVQDERAELWRLLFVALTRARDHLVVPLPQSLPTDRVRDRWIETLSDGLSYDGDTASFVLPTESGEIKIGVNDVELSERWNAGQKSETDANVAIMSPNRDELDSWTPRFLNPSTMYPLTEATEEHALAHILGDAIHTETNDVSDDIPLQFDVLGPDDIGTAIHDILTTLVDRGVSEDEIQSMGRSVKQIFDEVVTEKAPRMDDKEREGMWTLFSDVVDEFLKSDLWERIQRAESVRVEQPVDGLVSSNEGEIEIHGIADFVLNLPDGERCVTDIKIALTEQTRETKKRYELQAAAYAYLCAQQGNQVETVYTTVETFGSVRDTVTGFWPMDVIEHRLTTLIDETA